MDIQSIKRIIEQQITPESKRILAFKFVRDIPYGTINAHNLKDVARLNRADCFAKSKILGLLMTELGYDTRTKVVVYRLRDYPLEVKYIPDRLDYHYALELDLKGDWITLDPTYDPPLAKIGFIVNKWDGYSSTLLSEKSLEEKILDTFDEVFDQHEREFRIRLEKTYKTHKAEIEAYRLKFNDWLDMQRM